MLKQVQLSKLKASDITRFRESVEVTIDGEVAGILIVSNTDYISDQVKSFGELSNTCMPDPNRFEEAEIEQEDFQLENRDTADIKG